jgi:hypothetical protein
VRWISIAALALLLSGCGGDGESAAPQPISTALAREAPDIAGTTLTGETISLGDFRGRPVVVNVWSSW